MQGTHTKAPENITIASNIGRIGKPGDEDDLRVIETGTANLEVAANGRRFEVELPLRDVNGATVGALGLVWPYRAGQDQAGFVRKAAGIRDALAKRILNVANLMDPYPLDARATTSTGAQKLVEAAAVRHAEIRVLAIRGPSKTLGGFVLLGSTFRRHGKKALAEQLAAFERGEPAGVVHADLERYSLDLPLLDRSPPNARLMTLTYPWKGAHREQALIAKAHARRRIGTISASTRHVLTSSSPLERTASSFTTPRPRSSCAPSSSRTTPMQPCWSLNSIAVTP